MTDCPRWTYRDKTVYHETVTSNALERILWLEADRMGFLLPALTNDKLQKAREVVKNERWQTLRRAPFGPGRRDVSEGTLSARAIRTATLMIGSFADLSAARIEDVTRVFPAPLCT